MRRYLTVEGGSPPRSTRRRGAALVIVMIFAVAALTLVTTLLALVDKGTRTTGELNRHKNLQAVLKAGIAAAINEMNRDVADGPYDPGNDGAGAITRSGASGPNDGVPVTTTNTAGQTITLGVYRTTIRKVGTPQRDILTVVAAWPSFTAPANERLLAVAELEVLPGVPGGDFNPINFEGTIPPGNISITIDNNPKVDVTGIDTNPSGHANPIQANVPAANISDADLKAAFVSDFVSDADTFSGADPLNPDGTATGANTITQTSSNVFNDDTLHSAREAFADQVDEVLDGNSYTTLATTIEGGKGGGKGGGTVIGTGGTYVVPGGLTLKGKVSGSGTLIIKGSLKLEPSADFEWDGDIIIAGYDASHDIVNDATYTSGNGAALNVDGNFILLGKNVSLTDSSGNAGGSVIDGSLLMLAKDDRKATVTIDGGTDFKVEGVWVTYADELDYHAIQGSKTEVRSYNHVFTGTDASENKLKMKLENGSDTAFVFDNTQVQEAMASLWPYLGDSLETTTEVRSYWEQDAKAVLELQQAQIAGSAAAPFGVDYGDGPWGR